MAGLILLERSHRRDSKFLRLAYPWTAPLQLVITVSEQIGAISILIMRIQVPSRQPLGRDLPGLNVNITF